MLVFLLSRFSDNISSNYSFGLFIKLCSKQSCYESWHTFSASTSLSTSRRQQRIKMYATVITEGCDKERGSSAECICWISCLKFQSATARTVLNWMWLQRHKQLLKRPSKMFKAIKLLTSTRDVTGTNPGRGTRYFHKKFVFRSPSEQIAG